jgi:hypothetical protein
MNTNAFTSGRDSNRSLQSNPKAESRWFGVITRRNIMSTLSALRSVAHIAAIASVVGVLSAPAFAGDANRASVLRELGRASEGVNAVGNNAQSDWTARAQYSGVSQRSTQRAHAPDSVVNVSRSFDPGRLGHN